MMGTVLLTGGTRGIGTWAARTLTATGVRVVVTGRDERSGAKLVEQLRGRHGPEAASFEAVDLAHLASIDALVARLDGPLHGLLCNAGVAYEGPLRRTRDGVEWNVGINHLGHAHLVFGLLDRLQAGAPVVFTSSGAHRLVEDQPYMKAPRWTSAEELLWPETDDPDLAARRYPISKLCNALFALELHRRLDVHTVIYEPGFVPGTGLARDQATVAGFLFRRVLPLLAPFADAVRTARQAGRDLAHHAITPPPSGSLIVGHEPMALPEVDRDEVRADELWRATTNAIARIRGSGVLRSEREHRRPSE